MRLRFFHIVLTISHLICSTCAIITNEFEQHVGGKSNMANEILIVDDEDRIRRLLKLYLERESFEIHEASDGKEASTCDG